MHHAEGESRPILCICWTRRQTVASFTKHNAIVTSLIIGDLSLACFFFPSQQTKLTETHEQIQSLEDILARALRGWCA